MAVFRLRSTAVVLAAGLGLGLAGPSWAQGTPPVIAPPATSITSPDTPPSTSNGKDSTNSQTENNANRAGSAQGQERGSGGTPGQAGTPAPSANTRAAPADGELARADKGFMDQAAQNGHAEIESSKLALQKAQSDAVKTFARHMVDDHTASAQELQALASSKNHKLPDGPSVLQKGKLKLMSTHDGAKFDRSYIESMGVKAHRETIELFEKGAANAQDPDVKAYAQKTLPALRKHLEMAEQLERSLNGSGPNATHDAPLHNAGSNSKK